MPSRSDRLMSAAVRAASRAKQWAQAAGYVAAFTIERRPVTRSDKIMALPRFIVTNLDRGERYVSLLGASK